MNKLNKTTKKRTIAAIIILFGLTAASWNNGAYLFPSILITFAAINLFLAILRGRRKKIARSIELAVLLIGLGLAIALKFLPGVFLTIVAYIAIRALFRSLQLSQAPTQAQNSRQVRTPPAPTSNYQGSRQPSQPQTYPSYTRGYQPPDAAQNMQPAVEPYRPYQTPPPPQKRTTTTTQFEQPQVEYPQELPPQ